MHTPNHIKIQNFPITLRVTSFPFSVNPNPLSPGHCWSDFYHSTFALPVLKLPEEAPSCLASFVLHVFQIHHAFRCICSWFLCIAGGVSLWIKFVYLFSWWWTLGWSFGPLCLKLLYSCGFVNLVSFLLGKYLGVKLLGYSEKVCLSLYAIENHLWNDLWNLMKMKAYLVAAL